MNMPRCLVKDCVYYKSAMCKKDRKSVHLFRFPKNPELKEAWMLALKLKNEDVVQSSVICNLHFNKDCFDFGKSPFSLNLKPDAIPDKDLPVVTSQSESPSPSSSDNQETKTSHEASFEKSEIDKDFLVIDGFKYAFRMLLSDGIKRWHCIAKGPRCHASIKTDTTNTKILGFRIDHNHERIPESELTGENSSLSLNLKSDSVPDKNSPVVTSKAESPRPSSADNQEPKISYETLLEKSEIDKDFLVIDGFKYAFRMLLSDGTKRWHCIAKGPPCCDASIYTDIRTTKILGFHTNHNHKRIPESELTGQINSPIEDSRTESPSTSSSDIQEIKSCDVSEPSVVKSERGKDFLVIDGFKFYFQKLLTDGTKRWACVSRRPPCKASVKTDNAIVELVKVRLTHNHDRIPESELNRQSLKTEAERYHFFSTTANAEGKLKRDVVHPNKLDCQADAPSLAPSKRYLENEDEHEAKRLKHALAENEQLSIVAVVELNQNTMSQSYVGNSCYSTDNFYREPSSSTANTLEPENESDVSDDDQGRTDYLNTVQRRTVYLIEKDPVMHIGMPPQSLFILGLVMDSCNLTKVEIFLTLKKLKSNEPYDILADDFRIPVAKVISTIQKAIPRLASVLIPFIQWKSLKKTQKRLPIPFRSRNKKVQSIIDCFEVPIEQPSNPMLQNLCWSERKVCSTMKYLIAYTPDGLVTFVSKGIGGKSSDKFLLGEASYFLNCLDERSEIMAARGFQGVEDILARKKCTLVKASDQSAGLVLHVESVISRIRDFGVFKQRNFISSDLINYLDYMVEIVCGIINIAEPLCYSFS